MLETALRRFWRGVREPWELLGRMRQHPVLWRRYWRTVLVQAALTLVAGLAVFWVAKEGAAAWNDAFGPDDLEQTNAPTVAGSGSSAPGTPEEKSSATSPGPKTSPPAEDTSASPPGGAREPDARTRPPGTAPPSRLDAPERGAPVPPAPPTPAVGPHRGPPARAPAPPVPGEAPRAIAPSADGETAEEQEEDEESPAGDEGGGMAAALEEKIKALQEGPPEERGKRTAELVAAAVEKAKQEAGRAERHAEKRKGKPDEAKDELAEEREGVSEKLAELTIAAEALARGTKSTEVRPARRQLERELAQVEKDAQELERRGAPPLSEKDRARLLRARTALYTAHRHERGLAGRLGAVLALLAAIYASLGIAQTAILALSRDFHDQLSRDISLLVNVAPEDPPMRPKVRLDIPWLRRKTKRRVRFFIGFLPGAILINIIGRLVPPHRTLITVLTALWAGYWWMVMTAGQSARAWTPPETTQMPWYLRAWFKLTDKVFLFRWGLPRWWGRIWDRMSRNFHGPAERVEEQPLEFAGLSLSRALVLIPVVKLLLRPVFPVSVAHLLVEHASTARLPIPVTAAEVAEAAAHAPDAEARAHSGVASPVQGS
jgi:hypothetical protein